MFYLQHFTKVLTKNIFSQYNGFIIDSTMDTERQ